MAEPSYIEGKQRVRKAAQLQAKREARWNAKHDTMSGMTVQQAKKVRELEDSIADRFTEKAYVVDKNGKILTESRTGTRDQTSTPFHRGVDYSDSYLVHNHPDHEYEKNGSDTYTKGNRTYYHSKGMAARIGDSLSYADVASASAVNLKGVRARTPTYEFSVERGENGWGGTPQEISAFVQREFNKTLAKYQKPARRLRAGDEPTRQELEDQGRLSALANHKAMEAAAKKFGWKYTRMKRAERSESDAKQAGKSDAQRKAEAKERAVKRQEKAKNRWKNRMDKYADELIKRLGRR